MTVIKSLLLGSAATLVVVAGAQAADLPTKKGAPAAEYVKVCKIGNIAGFILPGSDTCLKISGYVTGQVEAGNIKDEYSLAPLPASLPGLPGPLSWQHTTTSMAVNKAAENVDGIGYSTRGQVNFDAISNTAYGPLLGHIEVQMNSGAGFDNLGSPKLNAGYVQWAGITAGRHGSFFDYLAGGDTWKDFLSPDHSGTPVNLLAYTASFGGGFSATVSLEQPENVSGFAGAADNFGFAFGTNMFVVGTGNVTSISGTALGARAPDIVASLDVTQTWGGAHLAGVAHNDRYSITATMNETLIPLTNPLIGSMAAKADTWGFGVIGGVTFNLPMLSAGSKVAFQGAYAEGAIGYSGATSPAWGESDQGFNTNGNGLLFPMADGVFDLNGSFHKSKAWSAAAQLTWKLSPNFEIDPEVAYADVEYDSATAADWGISPKAYAWWVGAVFDWSPVTNLDFAFDAIYESSHQTTPAGWTTKANGAFQSNSDGFNGRLRITRSF